MTSYSSFNLSDTLQECELGEVYTAVEGLWMPDKVSGGEPGPQLISCTCSDKLTPCWHALRWFLQRGRVAQIHASSQICSTTASTGTLAIEAQRVIISPLAGALWLPAQSKHRNHSGPGRDVGRQPGRHSTFRTSSYAIHSERSSARGTHTLLKQESEPIPLCHICLEPFSLQCRGWPVYSIGSTPAFAPSQKRVAQSTAGKVQSTLEGPTGHVLRRMKSCSWRTVLTQTVFQSFSLFNSAEYICLKWLARNMLKKILFCPVP